ncbi:MAG: DUF2961 domain-containing protein, partial [Caldithrix sp.]|nr:DUF2961 domain-containing protein [Caldithrix sp.]
EENPSVEVPVGDFFGTGFEYTHYFSQYLGMSSGGYFCYFPMPFNKNARIEIVNQTGQEIFAFYYHINYQQLEQDLDEDVAYFHAQWRRDIRTDNHENYTVLEAEGEGHFLGLNMSMQGYTKSLWYLEGDEMVYVDGESFPSIYGTGTEDYFTSGWYFKNGAYQAPYHGVIIKDTEKARIAAYRHHIPDPIPFDESIKFTIEHGHGNESVADFSSTAYWYQKEPHKPFDPIPESGLRIPLRVIVPNGLVEAESLQVKGSVDHTVEDMSAHGPEWSGHKQMLVKTTEPNQSFRMTINDLEEKAYNVDIYLTRGPQYGKIDVYYDQRKVASFNSYNETIFPDGKVSLQNLETQDGTLPFRFVVPSKASNATNFHVGIDGFKLEPVRNWIGQWRFIGPFPNPRESDLLRYGLDTVYPPQKEDKQNAVYEGVDGQEVSWQTIDTPENGYVSLWDKVDPYEFVISYAQTYIYSPEEQTVPLFIGSDDGSKVFLNGQELYRFLDVRIAAPDQDRVELPLKKGWNRLLLKLENNFGGYAFYARLIDRNENLTITARK